MAGIDARTGKVIGRADHIRQSIGIILRTPVGTRVMRGDFGFDCIDEEGRPKPGLTVDQVESSARTALERYEPRATFTSIRAALGTDGLLRSVLVKYVDGESREPGEVEVLFPAR